MGLDLVEFIMNIEDAFGIKIPNTLATSLTTPRKTIAFLYNLHLHNNSSSCLTQRAFYSIRTQVAACCDYPSVLIRPQSMLCDLLPTDSASKCWREIGSVLSYTHWPAYQQNTWLPRLSFTSTPQTLGDVARYIVAFSPRQVKRPDETWSWHEIHSVIDGLIRHNFSIVQYSLDDRFAEELRLD